MSREEHLEREELRVLRQAVELLREIRNELKPRHILSKIRIAHTSIGGITMLGPVTLAVGQKTTATVQGFDQNGAPFAIDFTANPVTWSVDSPTVASSTPNSDQSDAVVGVSAGVANLTATCSGLTDTETVTVTAVVPVLSSIKIDFA